MAPRGCGTERFASMQASGFSKYEVVAVVLAFPEVRAVLALMNGGIELRDRQHLVAAYETADVTEAGEIRKYLFDTARREMTILAFENQ